MTTPAAGPAPAPASRRLPRTSQVILVSSVMFTFITFWRTAAVVLCDLASTAYYIGGIVESAIGKAAPFFILAVMLFSYAVRSVYIESCSLFVRGGVYKVVKQAMGGFLAKLSVSALLFDYILTGPTSGVSAGQYLMGLLFQFIGIVYKPLYYQLGLGISPGQAESIMQEATRQGVDPDDALNAALDKVIDWRNGLQNWGAVALAVLVTIYFFRQNLRGIHESSEKALKIMIATTVMAGVMIVWCLITLVVHAATGGPINKLDWRPDLRPKMEYKTEFDRDPETGKFVPDTATGEVRQHVAKDQSGELVPDKPKENAAFAKLGFTNRQEDPIGFLDRLLSERQVERLRRPTSWLSIFGLIGLFIAFGHSILAMSGEETLAQVYREVESPKMKNFKKAAFIVFVYSLVLTAGISFLAVLLIPDETRMLLYKDNLIGGLARYVLGPPWLRLLLEMFVVSVGFLILAGAVNTAIIGSNGVLNRIAEDGVLPDWFLKPHPRYGTTYRLLWLILILQLSVVLFSGGDMVILGEAYAFGVVWSFVFKALAMVVLRFKDKTPREFKVPLNFHVGGVEVPFGLIMIFLILLSTALLNLFTKEVATVGGLAFTIVFLSVFMVSEHYHEKKLKGKKHEHIEQFNKAVTPEISPQALGMKRPYRKLVSIRSSQNLFMLEKALAETDPVTTDVVVMTAKVTPPGGEAAAQQVDLDAYDQALMTAVVTRAEAAGKEVKPLIVPTNNALHAVLNTAKDLQVNELVMGASNKYTADEQLDQIAFYWISLHGGNPAPLTVRVLGRDRDMHLDLGGGARIPRLSDRQARTVAELRAAGVGVDRVLLCHDGGPASADLFDAVLTMLDPQVVLAVAQLPDGEAPPGDALLKREEERAAKLDRPLTVLKLERGDGPEIVAQALAGQYDAIILPLPEAPEHETPGRLVDARGRYVVEHAHCRVLLVSTPAIPQEVVDTTPPPAAHP
jgi:amino acid transporter